LNDSQVKDDNTLLADIKWVTCYAVVVNEWRIKKVRKRIKNVFLQQQEMLEGKENNQTRVNSSEG